MAGTLELPEHEGCVVSLSLYLSKGPGMNQQSDRHLHWLGALPSLTLAGRGERPGSGGTSLLQKQGGRRLR